MAISFGKRKVKIKLIENPVTTEEIKYEPEEIIPVPAQAEKDKEDLSDKSFNRLALKEFLRELERISLQKLHLSEFTSYIFYSQNNRVCFRKEIGDSCLNDITLEKYISISKPTVFRRATGLPEAPEYRSRLVVLCRIDNKNTILVWSSILYEAFTDELLAKINALLMK